MLHQAKKKKKVPIVSMDLLLRLVVEKLKEFRNGVISKLFCEIHRETLNGFYYYYYIVLFPCRNEAGCRRDEKQTKFKKSTKTNLRSF